MKLANSTGQGMRNAITIRQNAIAMPPVAINRRSPICISRRDTETV